MVIAAGTGTDPDVCVEASALKAYRLLGANSR
jgi:hypothetical protein